MNMAAWGCVLLLPMLIGCIRSEAQTAASPADDIAAPATQTPADDTFDRTLFPGKTTVELGELLAAVEAEAVRVSTSDAVRSDYRLLLDRKRLTENDLPYADYVRVRTAFEATRAGGLWGMAWAITDQQPQSTRVWSQWRALSSLPDAVPRQTAVAECDELSALFAFVARRIGLSSRSHVGLFWPTANHAVAVWRVDGAGVGNGEIRIVIPTSQVYLDSAQSLGTAVFDPWRQARIYDYSAKDAAMTTSLPADVARYFISQLRRHGSLSQGRLQSMRNRREHEQQTASVRAAGGASP